MLNKAPKVAAKNHDLRRLLTNESYEKKASFLLGARTLKQPSKRWMIIWLSETMLLLHGRTYIRGRKLLILHYDKIPEKCTIEEVKSFFRYCKEETNTSSSTLNVRVCALKYYYRYIAGILRKLIFRLE